MGMMSSGLLGGIESNKHIPHRMCTYCIYIYTALLYTVYIAGTVGDLVVFIDEQMHTELEKPTPYRSYLLPVGLDLL